MLNRKVLIKTLLIMIAVLAVIGGVFAQTAPDRDGDGVIDDEDSCISVKGPASNNGCPERAGSDTGEGSSNNSGNNNSSSDDGRTDPPPPDSDGDGTADPLDRCPTLPGDGANYGCPEGQTGEDLSGAGQPTVELIPMPTSGNCVASPNGAFNVNIRELPEAGSNIVGVLPVNQLADVWGVVFPQGQTDAWYLVEYMGITGWISGDVLRFGGNCVDYTIENGNMVVGSDTLLSICDILNPEAGVYIVDCTPDSDEETDGDTFTYCVIELGDEAGMYEENCYEIEIPEGCVLLQPEAGVYILDCEEDGTPRAGYLRLDDIKGESGDANLPEADQRIEVPDGETVEICVVVPGAEAGMYEEECYPIEIPEGCTLLHPEAGVYILDCEEEIGNIQTFMGEGGNRAAAIMGQDIVDGHEYFTYCVIEQGAEAGMYEEVCYTIIVPNGCSVVSHEVGVYTLECEEETTPVNPQLGNLPTFITPLLEPRAETTRE